MQVIRALTPQFFKQKSPHLGLSEQRLLWLVRLRLVALFSQLPLTLIGRYYGYLNQSSHIVFTLVLIVLLAYNAHLYRSLLVEKRPKISELSLALHISFDLIAFTAMLALSGSTNNPFYAFFYVMAILGGIFASGKSSYLFAGVLTLCVGFIQLRPAFQSASAFDIIFSTHTFPYLLSQLAIPMVAFLIARSFGEHFDRNQQRLLALTVHSERLDRLRALGSLSAGFSHEFASPLQNAKLRLQRFLSSTRPDQDDLMECKDSIEDCERVLKRMNDSQFKFAEQDFEIVDCAQLTRESIQSWQETATEPPVSLELDPGLIRVNRVNFVQAIFNLMDNAAEATPAGKVIRLKLAKHDSTMRLSVCDQGPGFTRETLERLGEPFNTTKDKGTGLGIYSTLLFMNSVGGSLRVQNASNAGAIVELTFPMVEAE